MDNFELYHNLSNIKNIIDLYPEGKKTADEIEHLFEQITKRRYRVAVIGEFKRGKSSLINTLLGTEILPTDILPTTAVINRIVYDTNQKIIIKFKNGQVKETGIEEIHKYATKLDSQKEKTADTIREIVVHYPSVFGRNNIEILDTPGLNDNEMMSKTTIEVLDKIDTAIVVISAVMPLSMTEQKLVCDLISQKNIYHLTFVITFIDRISDITAEQDRVIELISRRIKEDTYEMIKNTYDDEKLLEKARQILKEPKVFAVSSKLAMQGFIKDDNSLIEKSRFSHFKMQLMALLTANQELDINEKVNTIVNEVKNNFTEWTSSMSYDKMIFQKSLQVQNISKCQSERKLELTSDFQKLDTEFENMGFSLENVNIEYFIKLINPKQFFIKGLSSVKQNEYKPINIMQALKISTKNCCDKSNDICMNLKELMYNNMAKVEERLYERNEKSDIKYELFEWRKNNMFPQFELTEDMIIENIPNIYGNIIPFIEKTYNASYIEYYNKIIRYVAAWRAALFKYETEMNSKTLECIKIYNTDIEKMELLKADYEKNKEIHTKQLMEIIEKII